MIESLPQLTSVFVIDDDRCTVRQIRTLYGGRVRMFGSIVDFVDWIDYEQLHDGALVAASIDLAELGGLDLINILHADDVFLPTILMGDDVSVQVAVDAMHAGASYILQRPFSDASLHKAVHRALSMQRPSTRPAQPFASVQRRLASLSPRQRELLTHVFEGRTNREIGRHLGISLKTVELHRSAMMQKMGATSLVELIRMAAICDELIVGEKQSVCA